MAGPPHVGLPSTKMYKEQRTSTNPTPVLSRLTLTLSLSVATADAEKLPAESNPHLGEIVF